MDADVIVVGAGLAGLSCARHLQDRGLTTIVLDRAAGVGGRVTSEHVDGYVVDRGFQVLNPAYPAVRQWIDVDALALQFFGAGVLVRTDDALVTVADPRREPTLLASTLRSGLVNTRDVAALTRWLAPAMAGPQRSLQGADRSLGEALDEAGATGALRRRVLDRFLAGVLVESRQASSAAFVRLLVRSFALGRPALPHGGMVALPRQVAAGLPDVRLEHEVVGVDATSVETAHGRFTGRAVVVATDPGSARRLTGAPTRATKGLVTWWFATDTAPDDRLMLAVDGRGDVAPPGPVWNTAIVSNAAPSYAPARRHLVQATTLLDRPDGDAPESDVRRHVGEVWRTDADGWQLVARHRIPDALPEVLPPLQARLPVRTPQGSYLAGDHRDTSSIQGALVSGQRAAAAVAADLTS